MSREKMMNFRASEDLANAVQAAAESASMPISAWLRAVAAGATGRPELAGEAGVELAMSTANPEAVHGAATFDDRLEEALDQIRERAAEIEQTARRIATLRAAGVGSRSRR